MLSYFELEKFICFCFVCLVFFLSVCASVMATLEIHIHFLISSPFNVGDIQDPYELFVLQPL